MYRFVNGKWSDKLIYEVDKLTNLVKKRLFLIVLTLSFFLSVYRISEDRIIFTDELLIEDAAYGFSKGEWFIVPKISGKVDLAKPPMVYWLSSLPYVKFEPTPILRSWLMPLFGLLTVILLYKFTYKFYSEKTALWSAVLLATSIPFIFFTKTANFDLPNAFFIMLTLYIYNSDSRNIYKFLFLSLVVSLGILTRSFLFIFPILTVSLDSLIYRKEKVFTFFSISTGIVLTLPWHYLAFKSAGENFINQYLKLPYFSHFSGLVPGENITPFYYYLIILVAFPPSIMAILYVYRMFKNGVRNIRSVEFQIIFTIITLLLTLTISKSRHIWYALPLIPLFSILSASELSTVSLKKRLNIFKKIGSTFLIVTILVFPFYSIFYPFPEVNSVRALRVMDKVSEGTLYMWEFAFFPTTRFFPNRKTEVLTKKDELKKIVNEKDIYFLLKNDNLEEFNDFQVKEVLFENSGILLVKLGK